MAVNNDQQKLGSKDIRSSKIQSRESFLAHLVFDIISNWPFMSHYALKSLKLLALVPNKFCLYKPESFFASELSFKMKAFLILALFSASCHAFPQRQSTTCGKPPSNI